MSVWWLTVAWLQHWRWRWKIHPSLTLSHAGRSGHRPLALHLPRWSHISNNQLSFGHISYSATRGHFADQQPSVYRCRSMSSDEWMKQRIFKQSVSIGLRRVCLLSIVCANATVQVRRTYGNVSLEILWKTSQWLTTFDTFGETRALSAVKGTRACLSGGPFIFEHSLDFSIVFGKRFINEDGYTHMFYGRHYQNLFMYSDFWPSMLHFPPNFCQIYTDKEYCKTRYMFTAISVILTKTRQMQNKMSLHLKIKLVSAKINTLNIMKQSLY